MNAQRGAFSGQISEEQLIQMLESISEKSKTSTKVHHARTLTRTHASARARTHTHTTSLLAGFYKSHQSRQIFSLPMFFYIHDLSPSSQVTIQRRRDVDDDW